MVNPITYCSSPSSPKGSEDEKEPSSKRKKLEFSPSPYGASSQAAPLAGRFSAGAAAAAAAGAGAVAESTGLARRALFLAPNNEASSVPRSLARKTAAFVRSSITAAGAQKFVFFKGKSFELLDLGSGEFHDVFGFKKGQNLELEDRSILLDKVVIRLVSGKKNQKEQQLIYKNDEKALSYILTLQPEIRDLYPKVVYQGKNGEGWLIEKLAKQVKVDGWKNSGKKFTELSEEDQKVLLFAKHWLEQFALTKREVIDDFHPGNVMWNTLGQLKIADFGELQHCDEDVDFWLHFRGYVKKWSAGNLEIQNFLISNMEQRVQNKLNELAHGAEESRLSSNAGEFSPL